MPTPDQIKANVLKLQNAKASPQDIESYVALASKEMQQVQPRESIGQAIKGGVKQGLSDAGQAVIGAGKGIYGTLNKLSGLILNPVNKAYEKISGEKPIFSGRIDEEVLKPTNQLQQGGYLGEKIGEVLATGKATSNLVSTVSNAVSKTGLGRLGGIAAKAGTEALAAGGITRFQGGSPENAKTAAKIGAAVPIAGGILSTIARSPIGKVFAQKIPSRLVNSIIKPAAKEFDFGKNPGFGVASEGIKANSINGLAKQITNKKKEIGSQIEKALTNAKGQINVNQALAPIDDAIAKAVSSGDDTLYQRLVGIRDGITKDFTLQNGKVVASADKNLLMAPKDVQKLKTRLGEETRWTGQAFDADVNKVRVKVYQKLDKLIDPTAPGIDKLNNRYANMLSAEKSIENRIKALERFDLAKLKDLGVGLGIGGIFGGGAAYSGDSKEEAILKGLAATLLYKVGGSTAVKTRAASGLARINNEVRPVSTLGKLIFTPRK